jgi:hypothetical protein
MDTIYVVTGSSGEYSDWTKWLVAAYEDEQAARHHAERADAAVHLKLEKTRSMSYTERDEWGTTHPNPWDEEHRRYEWDTAYTVEAIAFYRA